MFELLAELCGKMHILWCIPTGVILGITIVVAFIFVWGMAILGLYAIGFILFCLVREGLDKFSTKYLKVRGK